MPLIVVNDLNHILVDGVAAGGLLDVLANFKPEKFEGIQSDILAAFQAWDAQWEAAKEASLAAQAESHALERSALESKHAESIALNVEDLTQLRDENQKLKALVDALGGTERGQELAKAAKIAALQLVADKAQAELAALIIPSEEPPNA